MAKDDAGAGTNHGFAISQQPSQDSLVAAGL
jgi:hypothetical protein